MDANTALKILIQGTGGAYTGRRDGGGVSRREESKLDVNAGFNGLESPAGGLPGPMDSGGPYAVKGAAHAHDRMEERTDFHKSYVDQVQRAVDSLKLPKGSYHLPLRSQDGRVAGYAQFKGVRNRPFPVLATVLGPTMRPSGTDLELRMKLSELFDTDHLDPRPPESLAHNGHHQRADSPEQASYIIRRAFDGVQTSPKNEVIETEPSDL